MTPLRDKVSKALEETHILVLGSQILLGFKFHSVFQQGFEQLAPNGRIALSISLGLLLITFLLLVLPTTFHRIAEEGNDTLMIHRITTRAATVALLPFAAALALDLWIALGRTFGAGIAVAAGLSTGGVALFLWYGLEILLKGRGSAAMRNPPQPEGKTSLKDKIGQLLIEARIILPGAQALLGFQLVAYFTEAFDKLPRTSQIIHTTSMLCIGLTVLLLMTPAAYHRIVDEGEDTPGFDRIAARLVIGALVPLAVALGSESYVFLMKVFQDQAFAILTAAGVTLTLIAAWFVLPLIVRILRLTHRSWSTRPDD